MTKIQHCSISYKNNILLSCGAVAFLIMVLVVSGCDWFGAEKPPIHTEPHGKVTIAVSNSISSAPLFISKKNNYFSGAGIDVTTKHYYSGKQSLEAMFKGEADMATVADLPIVMNSFRRNDFSVVVTFFSSSGGIKVITRKDTQITTGKDLKHKKIGLFKGTTAEFYLDSYLLFYGITPSEVEIIDLKPADLPNALKSKQVDAISSWEPHAYYTIKALQKNATVLPHEEIYTETFNLVVMNDFARTNPEIIKKVVSAIVEAVSFITNNKEDSIDIVNERTSLDKKDIIAIWDDYQFHASLEQAFLIILEDEARWAIEKKMVNKSDVPNYLDYIYFDALEKVNPDLISMIH